MNLQEARSKWQAHKAMHEAKGVHRPAAVPMYLPDEWKHATGQLAMDAAADAVRPTRTRRSRRS